MVETNLGQFGYGFQTKIIAAMVSDANYLSQMGDLLLPDYFDSRGLKWIINSINVYFKEYRKLPTLDVFKVQLQNIKNDDALKIESVKVLKDVWDNLACEDMDFVKTQTFDYCKKRLVGKTFEDCLEDFSRGNYDEIVRKITAANEFTLNGNDFGLDYLQDVDHRYSTEARHEAIPTPWDVLNEIMKDGGLPKTKFGMIIAPTGAGKSWLAICLGLHALKQGKTVLHYTLELDDIYTGQRYDCIATKIPIEELEFNKEKIKQTIGKYNGKLFIKEYYPGTLTFSQLEAHIEKYTLAGHKPDMVIIDAPYLMNIPTPNNIAKYEALGDFYKELRGLAGRKDFALWGVDQVNREGSTKDEIGNDSISDSYAKLFALDFVASFSRKMKDKVNSSGRFSITKSRLGPDGMTLQVKFDISTATFEMYNERSTTGKKMKQETMKDSDFAAELGRIRFEQISTMNNNRTDPDAGYF